MNVLLVCTANMCRSPMAEAIFRQRLKELHWDIVGVSSAGTEAVNGYPPIDKVQVVCQEHGIDIAGFRSSYCSPDHLARADCILVMEERHRQKLLRDGCPAEKIFLLGSFDPHPKTNHSIADPVSGTLEDVRATYEQLSRCLDGLIPFLRTLAKRIVTIQTPNG